VILRLADGVYQPPGGGRAYHLEPSEDFVLQAFLRGLPLSQRKLADASGVRHGHKVLARLAAKHGGVFAPCIHLPGKRGAGGYLVAVQNQASNRQ
jgi:hypothetical protein